MAFLWKYKIKNSVKKILVNFFYFLNWNYFNLIFVNIKNFISSNILFSAFINYLFFLRVINYKFLIFYSRSKNKIWFKGKKSKNFQVFKSLQTDCDMDMLMINVLQFYNKTCHTEQYHCYFNNTQF